MSDPARLNQTLKRPIHRDTTLSDILLKETDVQYLIVIDESSGSHNLKLNEKSLYLTMFACQFDRYTFMRLQFALVPRGDMSQQKLIDNIFKDLPHLLMTFLL